MAVGIGEVAGVHEVMVLYWIDVGGAAIGGGCAAHRIDRVAAIARQRKHHFARRSWRDGTIRKGAPFGMGEQHEADRFTPHHARSRLIGELRIVLEADGFVESHGRLEVCDRQAHKNRLAHHSFLDLLGYQSPASGAKGASPRLKTIESPPNRHRNVVFWSSNGQAPRARILSLSQSSARSVQSHSRLCRPSMRLAAMPPGAAGNSQR